MKKKLGYILKRAEIHENLTTLKMCRFYGVLQITKKHPINILNIRVLLKIGCPDTFKARLRPHRTPPPPIYQRKTPTVPFVGFLFGWNVILTSATFFHYEERNKFIVAVIILMYRCKTFIEIMNSHMYWLSTK